jgi:hypothetical protein
MMSVDPAVRAQHEWESAAGQIGCRPSLARPSHDQRMWFARHCPISRDVKRPVLMQGPAAGVPGAGGVSPGGLMWVLLLGCDDIPTAARFQPPSSVASPIDAMPERCRQLYRNQVRSDRSLGRGGHWQMSPVVLVYRAPVNR